MESKSISIGQWLLDKKLQAQEAVVKKNGISAAVSDGLHAILLMSCCLSAML